MESNGAVQVEGLLNWEDAYAKALELLPTLDGSFDSRIVQLRGRSLLAALVLVASRERGTTAALEDVQSMIDREMAEPGSVLDKIINDCVQQVRDAAAVCRAARGCWFGDAVPFLAITKFDGRPGEYWWERSTVNRRSA